MAFYNVCILHTVVSLSFIFFFLPKVFISNQKSLKKKLNGNLFCRLTEDIKKKPYSAKYNS